MAARDFRPIVTELRLQGWTVEKTERGHWRATPPDASKGLIHFSESDDPHALMNTLRDLKRQGFQYPPPSKKQLAGERRLNAVASPEDEAAPDSDEFFSMPLAPVPEPAGPPTNMDEAYAALKDARETLTLLDLEAQERQRELEEATRAYQEAETAAAAGRTKLREAKALFDEMFATEEAS